MKKRNLIESVLRYLDETADVDHGVYNQPKTMNESFIFQWKKKSKLFGAMEIIDHSEIVDQYYMERGVRTLKDNTYIELEKLLSKFIKGKYTSTGLVLNEKGKFDYLALYNTSATNDLMSELCKIDIIVAKKPKFKFEAFCGINPSKNYIKIDGKKILDRELEIMIYEKMTNALKLLNLSFSFR